MVMNNASVLASREISSCMAQHHLSLFRIREGLCNRRPARVGVWILSQLSKRFGKHVWVRLCELEVFCCLMGKSQGQLRYGYFG